MTLTGSERFLLGSPAGASNTGDGVVTYLGNTPTGASSLTLINASATTGGVTIFAGATNTPSEGSFVAPLFLSLNLKVTYTGLTIEGGSGNDFIENDAKNGIVTDGNHATDFVILGGAGATATLGTGIGDVVFVGYSELGTNEAAGNALGDKVTFGAAATALLVVDEGAEAGSTAGTTNIGQTKVHDVAAGLEINFINITTSSNVFGANTAVAHATESRQRKMMRSTQWPPLVWLTSTTRVTNTSLRQTRSKRRSVPMTPLLNWSASPI